jgi:hypothetical protein
MPGRTLKRVPPLAPPTGAEDAIRPKAGNLSGGRTPWREVHCEDILWGEKSRATETWDSHPEMLRGNSQVPTAATMQPSTTGLWSVDEITLQAEAAPVTVTVNCTVRRPARSGVSSSPFP